MPQHFAETQMPDHQARAQCKNQLLLMCVNVLEARASRIGSVLILVAPPQTNWIVENGASDYSDSVLREGGCRYRPSTDPKGIVDNRGFGQHLLVAVNTQAWHLSLRDRGSITLAGRTLL